MDPRPAGRKIHIPTIGEFLIYVKNTDEDRLRYLMKRNTEMKKMMSDYCDRHSLDLNSTAFLFNGRHILPDQTPYKLQMENGDEIDAIFYEKSRPINLIVKGQDEDLCLFYLMKGNTEMKKLMSDYCERRSLDLNSTAFLFNGRRISPDQTSYDMQMEDGDEINAIFYEKSRRINLNVKGQVGFEASFGINRNTQLKKLMNVYCCKYDLDFEEVAFLFKGRLVESQQTPNELGMEDEDEMLALLQLRSV